MNDIYAHIISFDWQSALLAYDIGGAGFAEAEIRSCNIAVKSEEAVGCGRICLEGLPPGAPLEVIFRYPAGEKHLHFTTLPPPQGGVLGEFALIADPHISTKKENRKGRFFVESGAIAEDVIRRCIELGIDRTLWPGDITNSGALEEYTLAADIFSKLPRQPWLIPGNHDHNPDLWAQYMGCRRWVRNVPQMGKVIGIDTSNGMLQMEDAEIIAQELESAGKVIVMTHYQLFESPDINHTRPGAVLPSNIGDFGDLLKKITDTPSVIYAGHQNIMSVCRVNRAVQINLPQPPQYPCGWLRVRCFENGTYYTFEPISSEVWRQWSRRAGDAAAEFYGQSQWRAEYRRGRFPESCNFFLEN